MGQLWTFFFGTSYEFVIISKLKKKKPSQNRLVVITQHCPRLSWVFLLFFSFRYLAGFIRSVALMSLHLF